MNDNRRVVITGLGVATPIGIGISSFWEGLLDGRCGLGPIATFDASSLPTGIVGELPAFKITDYVPKTHRKSVKLMSRDIQMAVIAAYEAVRDASLPTRCMFERGEVERTTIDPARMGVNIGAGLICPDLNELAAAFGTALDDAHQFDLRRWGSDGMENLTPLWLLKYLPNMLSCHVTIVHDAQAMSNTITCGEASSHLAIGEAFRNIARGAMDVCICGGAESKANPMEIVRAALMERLVTEGQADPASACRPFAADRRGTVASEGSGLVVLESAEHARRRGARIYAELAGFGAAGNVHSWSEPDPTGKGFAVAVQNAMRDAVTSPEEIDLVVPFGCGIVAHDAAELRGWRTALGEKMVDMPAVATKGLVGNNGAGSGAIDFCTMVMALDRNTVPPSANTAPPDSDCTFRFARNDPVDRPIRTAVTAAHSLGGGQNAALIIKQFVE